VLAILAVLRAQVSVRRSAWLGKAERAVAQTPGGAGDVFAAPAFDRALAVGAPDRRTLVNAAKSFLRTGHVDKADTEARAALRLEPEAPNLWALMASVELAAGDTTAAHRDATRALTLLRDCPLALQTRALAATREGDTALAASDRHRLSELAAGAGDEGTARAARVLLDSSQ
jgi:hypothetical protein